MLTVTLLLNLVSGGNQPGVNRPEGVEGGLSAVRLFDYERDARDWRIIDDGVMGGVSKGAWRVDGGTGIFEGVLSLENNGGFSSVRSGVLPTACSDAIKVRIRIKGDGRRYQFRVRTTDAWDGPAYRLDFDTVPDTWSIIELPIDRFQANFRGREVTGMPPLRSEDFVTVGFLLADKKPGPFRLEVDWIELVLSEPDPAHQSGN